MVSKASDDFPEPESPVITVSEFLGMVTSMFFRLCTLAPITFICSSSLSIFFWLVLFILRR